MTDPIAKTAAAIVELINSKPRSPLKSEIEDVIRLHMPVRPDGYVVTQADLERAIQSSSGGAVLTVVPVSGTATIWTTSTDPHWTTGNGTWTTTDPHKIFRGNPV